MAKQTTELTVLEQQQLLLNPSYQMIKQFELQQRMAQMYVQSTIVPDTYKGNIGNCAIAIDMAMRMGANPIMVMQNLTPIYGRPSWSAKFLIATVNTCGRFEPLQFRFTEKGNLGVVDYVDYEYDSNTRSKKAIKKQFDGKDVMNIECVAYTTKKGKEQVLESSPITIELAIKEGWYTKSGSKWQTMPKQMLMYRAASWWTSVYAPEISMGFLTKEEVEDAVVVEDVPQPTAPKDEVEAAMKKQNKTNYRAPHQTETEQPASNPAPKQYPMQEEEQGMKVDTSTGELFNK